MKQYAPKNQLRFLSFAAMSLVLTGSLLWIEESASAQTRGARSLRHRPIVGAPLAIAPWNRTRMPVGSYLQTPALSAEQLRKQVETDKVVMDRYKKVFSTRSPEEVKKVLTGLKLKQLKEDYNANVWYVHPDGEVGSRKRVVKRGTYVYVDASDRPILAQVCGNPLTQVLGDLPPILNPALASSSIQEFLEDEPLPPRRTAVLNEAQMFDMSPMRIAPPTVRSIDLVTLPPPRISGFFAGVTPVPPPIVPPVVPPVVPPGIPPVIPPIIPFGDGSPLVPEPGAISLVMSALGSGVVLKTFHGARRRKTR